MRHNLMTVTVLVSLGLTGVGIFPVSAQAKGVDRDSPISVVSATSTAEGQDSLVGVSESAPPSADGLLIVSVPRAPEAGSVLPGEAALEEMVNDVLDDAVKPLPWEPESVVPEVSGIEVLDSGLVTVAFDKTLSESEALFAAEALEGNPSVVSVEPDYVVSLFTEGEEEGVDGQSVQDSAPWGLDRIDQKRLPLDSNYEYYDDAAGVRVYVVDTGVRSSHREFGGRVASGYSVISDGRGTDDCNGHGTHVAGTVAGSTYGVAKGATIVPVRVLNCWGSGSYSGVLDALEWIKKDAESYPNRSVVNMSLGGPKSTIVNEAVNSLVDSGVPVVVASGNSASSACNYSPAGAASAISVNASTRTDDDASFSNYGSCTDIYAPGLSIESAYHLSDSSTSTLSGTSMASPHVAGAVARLLASGVPGNADLEDILQSANRGGIETGLPGDPNSLLYLEPKQNAVGPAPSDVLVTVDGLDIEVSWSAPTTAGGAEVSGYVVRGFSAATGGTVLVRCETTSTSCIFGPLLPGNHYFFEVQALYSSGEIVTALPRTPGQPDIGSVSTYVANLYTSQDSVSPIASCITTSTSCSLIVPSVGTTYFVDVTAEYSSGFKASSAPRSQVQSDPGEFEEGLVSLTGFPAVGETMSVVLNDWNPEPQTVLVQWNRNGRPIRYASSADYIPVREDIGKRLSVELQIHRSGYETATHLSDSTIRVLRTLPVPPSDVRRVWVSPAANAPQVNWGVPLSRGGMAPSYLVEYSVVGSDSWSPVTGCDDLASTKCRVSALSQWGSPHVFRVQASNVSGASSWLYSAEYSPYTLGDSSALAEQVLAGPGNGKLNVSWATLDLDAYDRGSSITHVQVRAVNVPRGGAPKYCLERVASGDGACDVVRLRNADPHSLAIRVKNRAGWSGWANISAEVEKVTPVPVALR